MFQAKQNTSNTIKMISASMSDHFKTHSRDNIYIISTYRQICSGKIAVTPDDVFLCV
jgi:hypothetical protein